MKKILLGLILGLLLGGAAMWLKFRPHEGAQPEAAVKAAEKPAEAGAGPTLTKEQETTAGLVTAAPEAVTLPAEATAYGRVLDPTPLVALATEIATAQAAAAVSEKEFNRVRKLYDEGENASAQAVETAEAALQRDRVQLLSAKARLAATWGRAIAAKADLAFLNDALSHDWALVRIDVPTGDAPKAAPTAARVGGLTDESMLNEVELLGPAPAADPQMQGAGYLAMWREHPLPPGTALRVVLTLPSEPQKLLTLPRSAFVQHEGSMWVFIQTASGSYERRRVELARPLPKSYAIASGVSEGDKVVVVGAQQLLSTELQATGGEEP